MGKASARHFDVFNGDADGLCALQQLHLAKPRDSILITGVKRDIALLERVPACHGDSVTVLDVALGANHEALLRLLAEGVEVEYFDHHHAPQLAAHPLLRLHIDPAPEVCTSLLVNRHLEGRFRAWAAVGAFGDNMPEPAADLAASIGRGEKVVPLLKSLGECLNYNAYGESLADLTIRPAALFRLLTPYADPLDFMEKECAYADLAQRRADDMMRAMDVAPMLDTARAVAVLLPDAAWARRVVGSYANHLSSRYPERICAILVPSGQHTFSVSLRTSEACSIAADQFARRHGGDGRAKAAGISDLQLENVASFLRDL